MYYVYINYSEKFDKFYIGQTNNFRSEAIILEKKLKNLNRQRLLAFIEKYKDNYGSDAFGQNSDIPKK